MNLPWSKTFPGTFTQWIIERNFRFKPFERIYVWLIIEMHFIICAVSRFGAQFSPTMLIAYSVFINSCSEMHFKCLRNLERAFICILVNYFLNTLPFSENRLNSFCRCNFIFSAGACIYILYMLAFNIVYGLLVVYDKYNHTIWKRISLGRK